MPNSQMFRQVSIRQVLQHHLPLNQPIISVNKEYLVIQVLKPLKVGMVLHQLMNRIHFPRPIISILQVIKVTTFQLVIIMIFLMRHLTPLIATKTDRLIPMNFVNLLVHKTNKSIITRNSFFAEIFSFRFVYYQWKKNKKKRNFMLGYTLVRRTRTIIFLLFHILFLHIVYIRSASFSYSL